MSIQDQMLALITDWKSSGLKKDEFLNGTKVSKHKFNYWLNKFNKEDTVPSVTPASFTELKPKAIEEIPLKEVLRITTKSGLEITVFE